jgi:hypothetical protein
MTKKRKAGRPADPYKRGYANGIAAAADAVLGDLEEHGQLHIEYGDDGWSTQCKGCVLAAHHFPRLAERFRFALGVDRHEHDGAAGDAGQ